MSFIDKLRAIAKLVGMDESSPAPVVIAAGLELMGVVPERGAAIWSVQRSLFPYSLPVA